MGLIDRQTAIDSLWAERMKLSEEMERNLETCSFALRADNKARRNRVEEDIEIIKQLPPAQPAELDTLIKALEQEHKKLLEMQKALKNVPDTNVGDTISRQAAIADAQSWVAVNGFEKKMQNEVIEWLKEFPSAQPETATVTICRTRGGVTMWYECDACGEPIDQKDCYCRKCGRKLKHE